MAWSQLHPTRLANTAFARAWQVQSPLTTRYADNLSAYTEFVAKKLCPSLVVVPVHFTRYMELSNQIMDIFRRYDPTMCAAGCDEGYLKYVSLSPHHFIHCLMNIEASPNIVKTTS